MKEQEYIIKGTIDGMIKILQKDFNMSIDEAKFFIYVIIEQHSEDAINVVKKEELDNWYLTTELDKYKGQILNTRLVINFTTIKKNLLHDAYIFFVKYFFSRQIDLVLIGANLVYLVVSSLKKIKDTDYCIYARILELYIKNKNSFFDEKNIITANKEGKCDYQEIDWKCTYLGKDDNCTCSEQKIKLAFTSLENQNIIRKVGEHWLLVR